MLGTAQARTIAGVAMTIAIFLSPGLCQKTPNPPGGGGGTGPGGAGSRSVPGGLPNTTSPIPDLNRGIYLAGKVMMEDGTPPPETVTIERVCNAAPRAQAYTDSKGRFSFQVGQTAGVIQDASEQANTPGMSRPMPMGRGASTVQANGVNPDTPLANCELRAALAGYRSSTISLSGWRVFDNPEVGTIVLHRLGNVEGSVISVTSLQAPKDAKKAYDKGREALQKNKLADAEKEFRKAVASYPNYAAAWCELGRLQQRNHEIEEARQSYGRALAADPKFNIPYLQLADLAAQAQNWTELADISARLLALDPVDYPRMYLYNAVANLNLARIDAAEKSARAGQKLDTQHQFPKLDRMLALALARKKDYAGAAEQMRSYVQHAPPTEDAARLRQELAELESLAGITPQTASAPAPQTAPAPGEPPPPQ